MKLWFNGQRVRDDCIKTYLIHSLAIPKNFKDSVVLIREESDDCRPSNLEFLSSILVYAEQVDLALNDFRSYWSINAGCDFSLELIGEGGASLAKYRKRILKKLSLGEWSLNTRFLAFPIGSTESRLQAKNLIIESDLF